MSDVSLWRCITLLKPTIGPFSQHLVQLEEIALGLRKQVQMALRVYTTPWIPQQQQFVTVHFQVETLGVVSKADVC